MVKKKLTKKATNRAYIAAHLARASKYVKKRRQKVRMFMNRRPHRSFRLTRRRDYQRVLVLPGYTAFTLYVYRILHVYRRTFIYLILLYAAALVLLGGVTGQDTYDTIGGLLKESSEDLFSGGLGKMKEAGLLLVSSFIANPDVLSTDQQIYLGLMLLLVWLSTVWLLREFLIGRRPRLRDGLYNSAAPLVSTVLVGGVIVVQLLPIGLIALAYGALTSAGVLSEGFGSMLFWILATSVGILTLYWVTSSLLALVITTLPGMYPLRALKIAGDLVVGRRLRILYRMLWGLLVIVALWCIVLIPLILIDMLLKHAWSQLESLPLVPLGAAVVGATSTVWYASYVYLLYRGIVDDDTKPA